MPTINVMESGFRSNRDSGIDLMEQDNIQNQSLPSIHLGRPDAVFLGGSCGRTTWRKELAVPVLEAAGIKYYNPQRDDWSPDLVSVEAKIKQQSALMLFVIGNCTRGLASVVEATEYICCGKPTCLGMDDIEASTDFDGNGTCASKNEVLDINRMRKYLRDVAERHNVPIFSHLPDALAVVCNAHYQASKDRSASS
eukprot:m.259191 g.259191  ORF g.259191 m.259191 type:complete len:196 (-) comp19659_c1_seq4:100-687(-)